MSTVQGEHPVAVDPAAADRHPDIDADSGTGRV